MGNITEVIENGITVSKYEYDARGRRVSKNGITFTYNSNGKLIKQSNGLEFIYDHTGLLAVEFAGSRYFYRKNAQNDIIALLDNEGNIVVKYVYDAWGNQKIVDNNGNEVVGTNHIGKLNPFRYRSYYYDIETNLYFLKTRYYDPEICRFITIDDLAYLDADSINGLNLYAYCRNNPIKYMDIEGTLEADTGAILITSYKSNGLPVVGHSALLIKKTIMVEKDGVTLPTEVWFLVEYNTTGGENIKEKKSNAVESAREIGEIYPSIASGDPVGFIQRRYGTQEGVDYDIVELQGDYSNVITDSNTLNTEIINWDSDKNYNLIFHNCIQFARRVLVAGAGEGTSHTVNIHSSIPIVLVPRLYLWRTKVANKISQYTDPLIDKGIQYVENVKSSVNSAGNFISQIPEAISFLGNNVTETVVRYTNPIVQAGQNIYNSAINGVNSAFSWFNQKIRYLNSLI